ncbi:TBC domain-containing protein [Cryptosporidium ubiquitum]|uniref:TBC domain-containing protein n=1 Tax=Cryptosporidium ubiquitum TaxID=857276 RepID=A0A1J4MGN7_9CRYT|nr:TBC domain-containing protein [Cryptosporidium ubiquitum]OII72021.1 TBC domain-containing protein [Cryptosporidium ubiquitum]
MPKEDLEKSFQDEECTEETLIFDSEKRFVSCVKEHQEMVDDVDKNTAKFLCENKTIDTEDIQEVQCKNSDKSTSSLTFDYRRKLIEIEEWRFLCYDFEKFDLEKDHLKILSKLRKGIPPQFRGFFWMKLAEVESIKNENSENLYYQLTEIKNAPCCGDIYRDISRTFPRHCLFRDRNNHGQNSLFSVLRAYSLYNPDVGYCQGMGFIVGVLLMYMSEEDSFYMLISILDKYKFSGLYLPGLPLLNTHLEKLKKIFKKRIPNLYNHFRNENVDETMYASQWFMTIFAYSFNLDAVARIWDLFFLEGINLIFKISIAILKILKNSLFNQSFENILHTLKTAPYTININELIQCALSIKLNYKE